MAFSLVNKETPAKPWLCGGFFVNEANDRYL